MYPRSHILRKGIARTLNNNKSVDFFVRFPINVQQHKRSVFRWRMPMKVSLLKYESYVTKSVNVDFWFLQRTQTEAAASRFLTILIFFMLTWTGLWLREYIQIDFVGYISILVLYFSLLVTVYENSQLLYITQATLG